MYLQKKYISEYVYLWKAPRSERTACNREVYATLQWPVIGWVTNIYYPELLRASEGTLNRWSWLHWQSFVPIPVLRTVDVRQPGGQW
jgi:hypothetical protein